MKIQSSCHPPSKNDVLYVHISYLCRSSLDCIHVDRSDFQSIALLCCIALPCLIQEIILCGHHMLICISCHDYSIVSSL